MSKAIIAARRATDRPDHHSWVWVIPLKSGAFRVAGIEVPNRLVDDDVSFYEDDMITPYAKIVNEIDDVDGAVREAGADPGALDAPWHSDFPL